MLKSWTISAQEPYPVGKPVIKDSLYCFGEHQTLNIIHHLELEKQCGVELKSFVVTEELYKKALQQKDSSAAAKDSSCADKDRAIAEKNVKIEAQGKIIGAQVVQLGIRDDQLKVSNNAIRGTKVKAGSIGAAVGVTLMLILTTLAHFKFHLF